jgi:hypothetical protein
VLIYCPALYKVYFYVIFLAIGQASEKYWAHVTWRISLEIEEWSEMTILLTSDFYFQKCTIHNNKQHKRIEMQSKLWAFSHYAEQAFLNRWTQSINKRAPFAKQSYAAILSTAVTGINSIHASSLDN